MSLSDVSLADDKLTFILGILNTEQESLLRMRPPSCLFAKVGAPTTDGDSSVGIAKVASVEFEELDKENTEIGHGIHFFPPEFGVQLLSVMVKL